MAFMCKDVVENIVEYIEAELDYITLRELEKHLDQCPECGAFVETYKRMLDLSGKLKERTFVTPDIRVKLKVLLRSKLEG